MLQAVEACKLVLGAGDPLVGRLLVMDLLRMTPHVFAVPRDPQCLACGEEGLRTAETGSAASGVRALDPQSAVRSPSPSPESPSVPSPSSAPIEELSPAELSDRLRATDPPMLLDVREPWEHEVARIAGARLVPLNSLPAALSTLDPSRPIVAYCHHGMRSRMALEFLRERGLTRLANLAGGIDAWSEDVDPSVPRY
jgi:adenylyltransferase/sulfurtransferase